MTSPRTVLLLAVLAAATGCSKQPPANVTRDDALAGRIGALVETIVMSENDAESEAALVEARGIVAREGIPSVAKVGDAASYGFVFVNMLAQPPDFRRQLLAQVREAAARHELPEDAVALAEARIRQTDLEERYKTEAPSDPALRDEVERLYKKDQAVREKEGFDLKKMAEADQRTEGPLRAIFDRVGVPTYDLVGVEAAKHFVVMVQHQSPAFRAAVLPKLKTNVDNGQAEPGTYAMVYDRTQRDQGKNQLYGQQLECDASKALELAPMDDPSRVNARLAALGLMRVELYVRFARQALPDMCGAAKADK